MRFMMLMIPKGYESAAPGTVPDAKAVEAMMKYNRQLQESGVLLALDGLMPAALKVFRTGDIDLAKEWLAE